MQLVSSLLLGLSLILAVLLGPQTRPWSWGPSLLCLGAAVMTAIPVTWKNKTFPDTKFILLGLAVVTWFAWRAWISPVAEFALADILLLTGATGVFLVIRAIANNETAVDIFLWCLAALLIASVAIIIRQVSDTQFAPIYKSRPANYPSGFFGHYNDGANFLVGGSFLIGGMALFAQRAFATRLIWGGIAIAGVSAVPFTHSRGGILAAAIAASTFLIIALILGHHRRARWFVPALIALPVCGIALGWYLLAGWQSAQEIRSAQTGISEILDNSIRLRLISIAAAAIGSHPLGGGGSRSFSWECYRFWDIRDYGWVRARPEMVHNEFLQSITDYGLVGGLLISTLLVVLSLAVLIRVLFPGENTAPSSVAKQIGGTAALAGILVQSSFSFVLHLFPGILILGACLGFMSSAVRMKVRGSSTKYLQQTLITAVAVFIVLMSLVYGWRGTQLLHILWSHDEASAQSDLPTRSDALEKAIRIWPQAVLYQERALQNHKIVVEAPEKQFSLQLAAQAVSDYRNSLALHPYELTSSVFLANLLSYLDRDEEATAEYHRATQIQGGFEHTFRAHFRAASHLLKVASKQIANDTPSKASLTLKDAELEFEKATQGLPSLPQSSEGISLINAIHEKQAIALENAGEIELALETYDELAKSGHSRGHYGAGILLGNLANTAWSERRPSEALTRFLEARQRMDLVNELPTGVTSEMKAEYVAFLDRSIQYLREAKVEPSKKQEE